MAQPGGVLVRAGHTEAGCDLARARRPDAGGGHLRDHEATTARWRACPTSRRSRSEHGLKIGTIADLIHYRSRTERMVERIAERPLTTPHGAFRLVVYRDKLSDATHLALVRGPIVARRRDAGARARAAVGDGPARRRQRVAFVDDRRARSRAIADAGPRRGRAAASAGKRARSCASRADGRHAAAAREDGPAQLRHRRADPARPQRRPHAAARQAAQDAEHGGLRPRSHRLRERAAGAQARDASLRRLADATSQAHRRPIVDAATACRVGIVQSRFNPGDRRRAARRRAARARARRASPTTTSRVVTVPGALESPLALQRLAQTGDYDALVALGAVIRGETYHFEIVSNESAAGVSSVALEFGIPIGNGILTCDTDAQARGAHGPEGLRGGAGGARDGQPAATRSMTTIASAAPPRRASSCCRASTSASCRGNAARRRARRPRREPRLQRADQAYFDELWAGVTRDYDALLARARRRISTASPRSCRRSSARSSSSARGSSRTALEIPYRS